MRSAIIHVNQCSSLKLCSSGCSAMAGGVLGVVRSMMSRGVIGHHLKSLRGRERREGEAVSFRLCTAGVTL